MVDTALADAGQSGIAEAAALLHDRDILTITFIGEVPTDALHAFLRLLTLESAERRARGGPAAIWAAEGDPAIAIEQIDYKKVLAREEGDSPEPARRDDLWKSIVLSIIIGIECGLRRSRAAAAARDRGERRSTSAISRTPSPRRSARSTARR